MKNLKQLLAIILLGGILPSLNTFSQEKSAAAPKHEIAQGKRELLFMENRGQVMDEHGKARPDILFLGRNEGVKIAVFANGLSYQFEKGVAAQEDAFASTAKEHAKLVGLELPEAMMIEAHRLDMKLVGANTNPVVVRDKPNSYF